MATRHLFIQKRSEKSAKNVKCVYLTTTLILDPRLNTKFRLISEV